MKQTRITSYFRRFVMRIKQKRITDYFQKEIDYSIISWKCLECGIDMGDENPRQLCGKTRCLYNDF